MTHYNAQGQEISPAAFYAIQAARRFNSIGSYAAIRFVMKRANTSYNVALRLITIARQLIAIEAYEARQQLDFYGACSRTQAANLPSFLRSQAA